MPADKKLKTNYTPGLSIAEISGLSKDGPVIKLSSNENPFGPSPKALAAAQTALEIANIYPEKDDALLVKALAASHGRGLVPANFFAANGGVEALSLIEDVLIDGTGRAIICPPCFGAYTASLKNKNATITAVNLLGDNYNVDVDGILQAVTADTKLVYLCNPNNPTGTWFGQNVLDSILDGLPEHVTLIYDEVYFQFATEAGLPDAVRHVLDGRNIVIIHSFSKAYGLAGMRVGYGIAAPDLVKKVQSIKRSFHINHAGMAAAEAALTDATHLEMTVKNNHNERVLLRNGLQNLGLETSPSQANFLCFRCPKGFDASKLTEAFAMKSIMVRPAFFLPEHIRVTIGRPSDNLKFLVALSAILGTNL